MRPRLSVRRTVRLLRRNAYIGRMKALLPLLLLATACASSDNPPPIDPPGPAVTYTDAAGATTTVSTFSTYYVTATPASNGDRRAILVRSQLSNGSTLDVTYTYMGQTFPGATGPVTLNGPLRVDNYVGSTAGMTYNPASGGTISVQSITPRVVSGTYAGPLVSGGPSVRLVFDRLPVPN